MSKTSQTILVLSALIVVAGFIVLVTTRNEEQSSSEIIDNTVDSSINFDTPTEEETQATQAQKEEIINSQSNQNSTGNEVNPIISTWRASEDGREVFINGFVPGIVESGGVCTLTVSNGNDSVVLTSDGRADAQSTICGVFTYDNTTLGTGNLFMELYYKSAISEGYSDKIQLEL